MRSKNPELMKKISDFAENYYLTFGRFPSTTEISNNVGIARGTVYKYLVEMDEKGIIAYDGHSIITAKTEKYESKMSGTPLLGSIPCGNPIEEEENIETIVSLPSVIFGDGKLFMLTASGDSMTDSGIDDGDIVVLVSQNHAKSGDIVAAVVDGTESTLKTYYYNQSTGLPELHPENKKYSVIYPQKSLEIQGVVRKVIKEPRGSV